MIWTPNIAFSPVNKLLTTAQMEAEKTGLVWMVKEGNFTLNENSELVKRRMYRGDENDLVKDSYYSVDFICSFDLSWYPFLPLYEFLPLSIALLVLAVIIFSDVLHFHFLIEFYSGIHLTYKRAILTCLFMEWPTTSRD